MLLVYIDLGVPRKLDVVPLYYSLLELRHPGSIT